MSRSCPAMSRRCHSERVRSGHPCTSGARHPLQVGRPFGPTTLNGGVEGMTEQVPCPDVPDVYRRDIPSGHPSRTVPQPRCIHCGSTFIENRRYLDCGRAQ